MRHRPHRPSQEHSQEAMGFPLTQGLWSYLEEKSAALKMGQ